MNRPPTTARTAPRLTKSEENHREMIRITLSSATRTNQPTPTFPTTWAELRDMVETAYYTPRD